ncbi:MAG: precorrin-3B C(17)-methyltransferase [Firmicutes bacterium]|nr:precorrin-3B C(17)-methyltransferase [Bacillota bacterium]
MSKLYVVGIGPGAHEKITIEADRVLNSCQVIAGYTVYVDLIREYYPDNEFITTPMKQEKERCMLALEEASKGSRVAMVCSGDPVIYGMAGLLFQLGRDYEDVDIEVIPGITAALSGGSVAGAPLTHDFCVISLSDLLTDWQLIEQRLRCAAEGDFEICIYNPSSRKRADYLKKACDILLEKKSGDTVCAAVKNIGRDGESYTLMDLRTLREYPADMFTTVFIGNSRTENIGGRMVTPRGYRDV